MDNLLKRVRREIEGKRDLFKLQTSDNGRVAVETLDLVLGMIYRVENEADPYGEHETWEGYEAARDTEERFQREIRKLSIPIVYLDTEILFALREAWEACEKAKRRWHEACEVYGTDEAESKAEADRKENEAWDNLQVKKEAYWQARKVCKDKEARKGSFKAPERECSSEEESCKVSQESSRSGTREGEADEGSTAASDTEEKGSS